MKKTLTFIIALNLLGCSAVAINEEAKLVRIMDMEPANCVFLGEVDGSQGNWFTADMTRDRNILVGARNKIRNKAHSLGANVVVIKKSVDNSNEGLHVFGDKDGLSLTSSKGTYSSTLIGEAFYCEPTKPL